MSAAQWIDAQNFAATNTDSFRPDPCDFWRDLSLPLPLPEAQVIALCKIATRMSETCFESPSGMIAVFTGSDAAGKLMAAEALAYETQRTLCRVDRTEISEVDGQFTRIVDGACAENAILMLDNAESLSDTLLQSLKTYPGLSILIVDSVEDASAELCEAHPCIVDFPFPSDSE
ncbi:MAG TPA: hypothetical protein VKH40_15740 [Alloacidobacterium sp.]|nr:hypothetical protein [Alloacidobacterium sp.]